MVVTSAKLVRPDVWQYDLMSVSQALEPAPRLTTVSSSSLSSEVVVFLLLQST